jgi:hypothetical protein
MNVKVIPAWGDFESKGEMVTFEGRMVDPVAGARPTMQVPSPLVGLALTDKFITDGVITAEIEFEALEEMPVAEIVIGFDHNTKYMNVVGFGGGIAMLSIREFGAQTGPDAQGKWIDHKSFGDRANLRAKKKYHLAIALLGSRLTVEVDGVRMAEQSDPWIRNKPNQVGIFCQSSKRIFINKINVTTTKPKAFVVMQFSDPYNDVHGQVIKKICSEFEIEDIRADEIYGPGSVIEDIVAGIATSRLVIADISTPNPNVFFEVGYALALNIPIILMAQKNVENKSLPFDVSGFRVLFYENSIAGKQKLEDGLRLHLQAVMGRN